MALKYIWNFYVHYKSGLRLIIFILFSALLCVFSSYFHILLGVIYIFFAFWFYVCLEVVVKYINHKNISRNSVALFALFGNFSGGTTMEQWLFCFVLVVNGGYWFLNDTWQLKYTFCFGIIFHVFMEFGDKIGSFQWGCSWLLRLDQS